MKLSPCYFKGKNNEPVLKKLSLFLKKKKYCKKKIVQIQYIKTYHTNEWSKAIT